MRLDSCSCNRANWGWSITQRCCCSYGRQEVDDYTPSSALCSDWISGRSDRAIRLTHLRSRFRPATETANATLALDKSSDCPACAPRCWHTLLPIVLWRALNKCFWTVQLHTLIGDVMNGRIFCLHMNIKWPYTFTDVTGNVLVMRAFERWVDGAEHPQWLWQGLVSGVNWIGIPWQWCWKRWSSTCSWWVQSTQFTGPRSAVGYMSGYRCVYDCRSRGGTVDPGPVPYFRGDWS